MAKAAKRQYTKIVNFLLYSVIFALAAYMSSLALNLIGKESHTSAPPMVQKASADTPHIDGDGDACDGSADAGDSCF